MQITNKIGKNLKPNCRLLSYFVACVVGMVLVGKVGFSQEIAEKGGVRNQVQPLLIYAKGKIDFNLPNLTFSAQLEAKIVAEDSATMSFYGPMGVLLAKVYSNKEHFQYYDVFNNWAVVGTPTREKIYEASQVPLCFVDFVRLFKGQLLFPLDSMKNSQLEGGKRLFSYKGKNFVDFFLVDSTDKLVQFQKKSFDDKVLLNILYPEYVSKGELLFPKRYLMGIEERKGTISVVIEKLEFDFDTTKPFSFNIPKSVEIFEFN